jgi:hypothetical protein
MRYNKFETDPLGSQSCVDGARSGSNAISERADLTSLSDCFLEVAPGTEGGIDLKYSSFQTMLQGKHPFLRFLAQAGPTYDDQPVFVWSKTWFANLTHAGQPDVWNFPYVDFDLQWTN